MKAKDLRLKELVAFGDGVIDLHGRRLVLHSIDAFAHFRKDLVEMVGLEQTRRILTRFGYFWGNADAAAMTRIFSWDTPMEWLMAGPRMHALEGVARVVVKTVEMDEASGRFSMEVAWYDSGEAEEHLAALGEAAEPSCWMLTGYASGYASFCMKRDIYFVERKCRAAGDRVCMAVGKDEASWGPELKPYLTYFKAADIQGKVLSLTEELKKKTRELARQRRKLARLRGKTEPALIEVRSASFRRALEIASRAAPFDTSVLVTGETGSGKEVLARYIHEQSERAAEVFLAVNCGALPETLLESELFGHKAGAFTGAVSDRTGLFEQAAKGTIFLDEIGDIGHAMQMKLLRVLQNREIFRVGESVPRKIDVRVIAATNKDLDKAVAEGRFREDLLYRLRVIEIEVPPLRERREDILPLARHFAKKFARRLKLPDLRLDATCLDYLLAYSWPGNVRELENALERAAVLSVDQVIRPESLPPKILHAEAFDAKRSRSPARSLAEVERDHIHAVLAHCEGNRTRAAEVLGISPSTLWRKLKAES